jgi:hypothetical protein
MLAHWYPYPWYPFLTGYWYPGVAALIFVVQFYFIYNNNYQLINRSVGNCSKKLVIVVPVCRVVVVFVRNQQYKLYHILPYVFVVFVWNEQYKLYHILLYVVVVFVRNQQYKLYCILLYVVVVFVRNQQYKLYCILLDVVVVFVWTEERMYYQYVCVPVHGHTRYQVQFDWKCTKK